MSEAIQLLKDPEQKPDEVLLKRILNKDIFEIIQNVGKTFILMDIDFQWRYYNDGKAWLGKAIYKSKTVVWISVWDDFIKASFYFSAKTRQGVLSMDLNEELKTTFSSTTPVGKLIPLILDIKDEKALQNFIQIIGYKKSL
ncbi:DUF3788 family protein [Niabella aquatica]